MVLHHLQRFCNVAMDVIYNRLQSESVYTLLKNSKETQDRVPKALTLEQETPNQACLVSLAFPEMNDREHDIASEFQETCTWIFTHEKFLAWLEQQCGMLWIMGKPGAGKSTLLKYIVFEIKRLALHQGRVLIISHFFHGRGADIQKGPLGLFRSLLHQLLREVPEMLSGLTKRFHFKRQTQGEPEKSWKWHPMELQKILESSILEVAKSSRLQIFVDALDECGELEAVKLVDYFQRLVSETDRAGGSISICFSCRHYPILTLDRGFEVRVEDENLNDILLYIRHELYRAIRDESKICILERDIAERASGSFQWVVLVVSQVCDLHRRGKSIKAMRAHIKKTPGELNHLYRDLLQQISEQSAYQSLQIMQWICFAIRPLTLDELRYAMVVDADTPHKSLANCQKWTEFVETEEEMKLLLYDLCRGLAEVTEHEGRRVIQFIHQSVVDFLVQDGLRILDPSIESAGMAIGRAHFRISRSCIKYISMEEVGSQLDQLSSCNAKPSESISLSHLKLLKYAVECWLPHMQVVEAEDISQGDLLHLFQWPSNEIIKRWIYLCDELNYSSEFDSQSGLLHVASASGLTSVVQAILEVGTNIELNNNTGEAPLSYAISGKHEDIVRLLLTAGANLESKNSRGWTPLIHAIIEASEGIASLLLSAGVELESKDLNGLTPLLHAVRSGNEGIIKALLLAGANTDSKDSEGLTPIMHATGWGHINMVKMLLSAGANPESRDFGDLTPLMYAADEGNEIIASLLISAGACLESKDARGWTPLIHAIQRGSKTIVDLLISLGANLETIDSSSLTPLMHSIQQGNKHIVNLLISVGANLESKDSKGWVPLAYAIYEGHLDLINSLISAGADLESTDFKGWTPLMHALRRGTISGVYLLLSAGANLESRAFSGWTPLMHAVREGDKSKVSLLLSVGAQLESRDLKGRTPLIHAAGEGYTEIVNLLLLAGAMPESKDAKGWTPLMYAVRFRCPYTVELLQQAEAGAVFMGPDDKTALSVAIKIDFGSLERLLKDRLAIEESP